MTRFNSFGIRPLFIMSLVMQCRYLYIFMVFASCRSNSVIDPNHRCLVFTLLFSHSSPIRESDISTHLFSVHIFPHSSLLFTLVYISPLSKNKRMDEFDFEENMLVCKHYQQSNIM